MLAASSHASEPWHMRLHPERGPAVLFDSVVQPFHLPPGLELLLGDVHGGSETPNMVREVLKWQREQPATAGPVWAALGAQNARVGELLQQLGRLAQQDPPRYATTLRQLADVAASSWSSAGPPWAHPAVAATVHDLRTAFCGIPGAPDDGPSTIPVGVRPLLRAMSRAANVDVEPPSQTALLDFTCDQPGVLFAGVPGAGMTSCCCGLPPARVRAHSYVSF